MTKANGLPDKIVIGQATRRCDGCDDPRGDSRWFEIDSKHGLCWRCCNLPSEERPKQLAGKLGE